ncbi:transmembrane protein 200C-like [Carcharodon carcharias]|uniref:transmembrane protein 200C-like n=1 Tax=Carcharodon carcharias TaxID=13397 RepID=UPI001B7DD8A3|nr:transmembrane protein 200C-like [Carcharodon carcharias]
MLNLFYCGRDVPNASTGFSPFELVSGHEVHRDLCQGSGTLSQPVPQLHPVLICRQEDKSSIEESENILIKETNTGKASEKGQKKIELLSGSIMIATGGLLRITARTNDSFQSSEQANKSRKKMFKKRKNDVVMVKAKLELCSISGLITAIGILVMLGGIAMVLIGYWPIGYKIPEPNAVSHNTTSNYTTVDTTSLEIISEFVSSYIHSDKLKILGPLVLGIGIFLFICANAVLHENRDKKTKVINMQDIYSTMIDIHNMRKKEYGPFNGFVNYVQCKSIDNLKFPASYDAVILAKSSCQTPTADGIKKV